MEILKKISGCLFICLAFCPVIVSGQSQVQKGYFRSPVDFPITLSGSFGEIRQNHFHSGIDIRTGGDVGKPVYAVADGYVSRINISPYGFGKTIYIHHPNGYTSVYAHLNGYSGAIAKWARDEQYKRESFAMDAEVPAGVLKVSKGDIIAYSGNSGASGGPHLHFEIRDGASQEPMDPLAFGIPVSDRTPPRIYFVRVLPHGFNSLVNFSDNPVLLPVTEEGGKYRLKQSDTVKVSGRIIFGIETFDFHDGSTMKNGIRTFELYVDDEKRFGMTVDRFAFADTRYVNSILDYPLYIRTKHRVVLSYIAPNDKLKIFDDPSQTGVIPFTDNRPHKIRYVAGDVYGNKSSITFWVKSSPPPSVREPKDPSILARGTWMRCTEPNTFKADGIVLSLPGNALYEDLDFLYAVSDPLKGSYSPVHTLHNKETPIHTWCDLSIRADKVPANLQSKAVVARVDGPGDYTSAGGTWEEGWMKCRIRDFGSYIVLTDTVPPAIRPVNISQGKNISKQGTISLKISDDLSGIKTYRGTLNGKWILMDYDAKRDMLTYKYDDRIRPGKNAFRLVVSDNVGNRSEYDATLTR
jgi:hypothetical protein